MALAAALLAAAATAQAQSQSQPGLALDRFDPSPAGDRLFGVQSPYVAGHLTPHVMILADYAHDPLVIRLVPANTKIGNVVTNQLFLHVNGGLALWNRLYFNIDVPLAVFQSGENPMDPSGAGQQFPSPSGVKQGDFRFGLRVRLFGEYHDPFQIGIGGYVWVPMGSQSTFAGSYTSTGQVRGLPQLILGGRGAERVVWALAGGPELDVGGGSVYGGIQQGSMFKYGGGIAVLLGEDRHFQIGPEVSGTISFKDIQKRTTNLEALLGLRYRFARDFEVGAAAGPGLTSGIGTPDARAILSIAYTPEQILDRDHDGIPDREDACPDEPGVRTEDPKTNGCPPPKDRDHDGILDEVDACPDEPGVADPDPKKNGCPPPKDRDGDGIFDFEDACPDVKGVRTDDPKTNGCPPPPADRDGDGIPDAEDACPDVKGVRTDDPKTNGCPPDRDGDGIIDAEDACPDEKGVRTEDPRTNGCPKKTVVVSETEVLILEQVQFDTGKATIKKVSDPLLDEVAKVLKDHPELLKIEVQGHTDDRGVRAQNQILSDNRAKAVMKALIKRGIAADRLTAKGYGQDKPIDTNTTDAGRQKNRRVQFNIVEKKPKEKKP